MKKIQNGDTVKVNYTGKFEDGSIKIKMGKFNVFLYETAKLPVSTADEPDPLI